MKTKRMKSILLIGLAMLVVAGVIWGSFQCGERFSCSAR